MAYFLEFHISLRLFASAICENKKSSVLLGDFQNFSIVGFLLYTSNKEKRGGWCPWTKNTRPTFVQGKASSKTLEIFEDFSFCL